MKRQQILFLYDPLRKMSQTYYYEETTNNISL